MILPDYKKTFLSLKMPEENVFQLTITNQTWRLRGLHTDWKGTYVDKASKAQVEKGTPNAEYVRYSDPFGLDGLKMWLDRLPPTVMYYECLDEGAKPLLEHFKSYPLLVAK